MCPTCHPALKWNSLQQPAHLPCGCATLPFHTLSAQHLADLARLQGTAAAGLPAADAADGWAPQPVAAVAAAAALPQDAAAGAPGSAAELGTQQPASAQEGAWHSY